MPGGAKTCLRRRRRRSRRRAPHSARCARSFDAGRRADLRDRPRPRTGRRGVSGTAAALARHRGVRGRGVLDRGRRPRLIRHRQTRSGGTSQIPPRSSPDKRFGGCGMLAPSGELLRAGMALKLNHLKRAAQSYLRDRTNQTTGRVTSYAVAAGLFAVAGLFLIATFFVGLIALYRWVAITYGQFWGFGAVAAVLLVFAATCAGVAMAQINRRTRP